MGGMETQQSVVMVTDGALGTHQFVITDGLDGGTQVCMVQFVLYSIDGALGTHQFVITDGLDGGTQVCIYSLFFTP